MTSKETARSGNDKPVTLDLWLSFDKDTHEHYESEHGAARALHLRHTIFIGLILYNMYNLTGLLLMPDIVWQSLVLRILVVTPASLGLAYLVCVVGAGWREWLVTFGAVNAYIIPVFLFWLSDSPFAAYSFGEFSLTLVFGNMLLALRFRQAVVFTSSCFGITVCGLLLHPTLDASLLFAFILQIFTACVVSLYGNYLIEKRRCTDYAISRTALIRAHRAEHSEQALTELSRTDALTGLPNRRFMDETLDEWLDGTTTVAVLMIDLDYFKMYNDTLGHPAGDDCLQQVARAFLKETKQSDSFCARFGGEEFTIAYRNIDELEAARRTSRLVQAITAWDIPHPGRHDGIRVVTISVGMTFVPQGSDADKDTILANADMALYRAKRNGRNGYAIFKQSSGSQLAS